MMELDELKNAWTALDERLKENEMLNKRIVEKMLCEKSNKSLNKLMSVEFIGVLIALVAIPLCIGLYNLSFYENILSAKVLFIVVFVASILTIIWTCYKLNYFLMKLDFSKSVGDNMYYINRYNVIIKKEKIAGYFIVIPIFSLLSIWGYYELKVSFSLWIFLFVALTILIAITYWIYKKIYDANIQSIKKSLDELKELEEE